MGFSDLGRSILRNNDRLRRNLRDKYFGSAGSGKQYSKSEADRKEIKYLPKLEVKNSESKYRYQNWANMTTLVLILLFTIFGYLTFDHYFGKAHSEYIADLESISEHAN
jgi:hypothetical protein